MQPVHINDVDCYQHEHNSSSMHQGTQPAAHLHQNGRGTTDTVLLCCSRGVTVYQHDKLMS